jgi:hypothetical protein
MAELRLLHLLCKPCKQAAFQPLGGIEHYLQCRGLLLEP